MKGFQQKLFVATIVIMLITPTLPMQMKSIWEIQQATVNKPTSRIINGEVASDGQFPFFIRLTLLGGLLDLILIGYCGGSLIRPNWILTAAHCAVRNRLFPLNDILAFYARAGSINANGGRQTKFILIQLLGNSFPHPDFDGQSLANDIAVLKTSTPFTLDTYVNVIQVVGPGVSRDAYQGQYIKVCGFGKTSNDGSTSDVLLYTEDLRVIAYSACYAVYTEDPISENVFCVEDDVPTVSAICSGDSGGPATQVGGTQQIGVVSFGASEGCDLAPQGFTHVSAYSQWITDTITANN